MNAMLLESSRGPDPLARKAKNLKPAGPEPENLGVILGISDSFILDTPRMHIVTQCIQQGRRKVLHSCNFMIPALVFGCKPS